MFDLDDTLAESFKPPAPEMIDRLEKLIRLMPVGIITGASLERMRSQFLQSLAERVPEEHLYIFPTSSAEGYQFKNGEWQRLYGHLLSEEERIGVAQAIEDIVASHEELRSVVPQGKQLFARDAQVAFTLIGVEAPLELKKSWDTDGKKRAIICEDLSKRFPDLEILLGGTTTIDITKKGVDKACGVKWFSEHLGIPTSDMLYVGDAFFEGGNDRAVIPTGIATRSVSGPDETLRVIDEVLHV